MWSHQSSPSNTFLLTHSHTDDVFTHLLTHVLAYLLTHVPTYLPPPRTYGTKPSRTEATPTTSTTSRRCTSRVSAPTSASTSMAQSGPADLRCSEDRVCTRLLLRGKRCASHRRFPDGAPLSYFRRTAAPSLPSTLVSRRVKPYIYRGVTVQFAASSVFRVIPYSHSSSSSVTITI